mmetsp:Transcript_17534/g.45847  ORF Transcript_17534/g.45847 Transcript_17534/m.45847 type:complete len:213 (+) Transcript_17534:259-897(+)
MAPTASTGKMTTSRAHEGPRQCQNAAHAARIAGAASSIASCTSTVYGSHTANGSKTKLTMHTNPPGVPRRMSNQSHLVMGSTSTRVAASAPNVSGNCDWATKCSTRCAAVLAELNRTISAMTALTRNGISNQSATSARTICCSSPDANAAWLRSAPHAAANGSSVRAATKGATVVTMSVIARARWSDCTSATSNPTLKYPWFTHSSQLSRSP